MIAFISGHLDLTDQEFEEHYLPKIGEALKNGHSFVVGDAKGADTIAQKYFNTIFRVYRVKGEINCELAPVTVYHMFKSPRNNAGGFKIIGGFQSDDERDAAMTAASDYDIAWVRPGREKSGTAKNLARRNHVGENDQL